MRSWYHSGKTVVLRMREFVDINRLNLADHPLPSIAGHVSISTIGYCATPTNIEDILVPATKYGQWQCAHKRAAHSLVGLVPALSTPKLKGIFQFVADVLILALNRLPDESDIKQQIIKRANLRRFRLSDCRF